MMGTDADSKVAGPKDAPGETVVIKIGGEVVGSAALPRLAAGIGKLVAAGARVAVVHGAGPQVSALQERLGIVARKIVGRRYTDEATLQVVKLAVAGQVNVDLCAGLRQAGLAPVGLHGAVWARKRPPRVYPGAGDQPIDLGLVGDVAGFDLDLLATLWQAGRVPVLACLGVGIDPEAGAGGAIYNINADTVAAALSRALPAQRLVLCSDVPVRRDLADPQSRIDTLTAAQARALIADGVARGGMVAKLEEAFGALSEGVAEVVITADLDEESTVLRL